MALQTDLMIELEDRPGAVAHVGEVLGGAGINIEGMCALISGGRGLLHVLVADGAVDTAQRVLADARIDVHTLRQVWVAQCPDAPGALGRLLRVLADDDLNLDLLYLTTTGRVVLGAEDLEGATALLT